MILALLATVALAAPTPTETPFYVYTANETLRLMQVARDEGKRAAIPRGAWVVTATATSSPTARPLCERIGHDWPEWDRDDKSERALAHLLSGPRCEYRKAHPHRLYPDGDDGRPMLVRCRRCNLWKEVGECCR